MNALTMTTKTARTKPLPFATAVRENSVADNVSDLRIDFAGDRADVEGAVFAALDLLPFGSPGAPVARVRPDR